MTKILWVDDNWHARATMELLQMEGYETVLARNSVDAYKKLISDKFDVMIVDGGTNTEIKDGKNLGEVVKEEFPKILRICFTGGSVRQHLDQYMTEFDAVISRMYGITDLCEVIRDKI